MTDEHEARLAELAGAMAAAQEVVTNLGLQNTPRDPIEAAKARVRYGVARAKLDIASISLDNFIRARVAEAV